MPRPPTPALPPPPAPPRSSKIQLADIVLAAHLDPPLSTVRQPIEAAGQALLAALLSQLAGERVPSTLLPTERVVCASRQRA